MLFLSSKILSFFNPLSIKITKAGFIYIALSIFLGISAVNTGNNLLFVIVSMLLSFMWLSGVFSRANLSSLEVTLLYETEIYARKEGFVEIEIKKKVYSLPSFLLRVRGTFVSPDMKYQQSERKIPFLRGSIRVRLPLIAEMRGKHRLEKVEVTSLFPMGLFERKRIFDRGFEFVVYPEPSKCDIEPYTKKRSHARDKTRGVSRGSEEFERLEDYHQGVPIKFIFWKSFAKWDDPKRKVFVEGEPEGEIITVENLPGNTMEEKLSCATYLVLRAYERRRPLWVSLGGNLYILREDNSSKRRVLSALALYGKDTA